MGAAFSDVPPPVSELGPSTRPRSLAPGAKNVSGYLRDAAKAGRWILIDNAHLAPGALQAVEDFVAGLQDTCVCLYRSELALTVGGTSGNVRIEGGLLRS